MSAYGDQLNKYEMDQVFGDKEISEKVTSHEMVKEMVGRYFPEYGRKRELFEVELNYLKAVVEREQLLTDINTFGIGKGL